MVEPMKELDHSNTRLCQVWAELITVTEAVADGVDRRLSFSMRPEYALNAEHGEVIACYKFGVQRFRRWGVPFGENSTAISPACTAASWSNSGADF